MPDEPLADALRRHHDDRIPVITRAEIEAGAVDADTCRPSRRTALVAAAAIVALVAGGLAARTLTRDADGEVIAGPGGDISAWCAALAAPARIGEPVVVFLAPDADSSDVADVGDRLHSTPGVELVRYHDRTAAFAQAQVLFADQPTMLSLLREGDVPTSFRVTIGDGGDAGALAREVWTWPGVQQVETALSALPPDPDGAGPSARVAGGWRGDDRVVEQIRWLADGGPADIAAEAWETVRAGAPEELADAMAALDPLLDPHRPAPVPTAADRTEAQTLLTAADERCDLRPRPQGGDDDTTTATSTEPP